MVYSELNSILMLIFDFFVICTKNVNKIIVLNALTKPLLLAYKISS